MDPGTAWSGQIYDIPVEIDYTNHFIDRYKRSERGRPAVARFLDEGEILDTIQDAVPDIAEAWAREGDIQGVITSRSQGLNMSFLTEEENDELHIVMKNMMLKEPFQRYRPFEGDIQFQVAGKDAELTAAVLDHLATLSGIESGEYRSPEAVYEVALRGRRPSISRAAWLFDTRIFPVS